MPIRSKSISDLSRPLALLLLVAAGLIVIGCAARQVVSWRNFGDVEDEGGIWTGLALDASDGIVYRPIVSDIGYGGTRYGPLHFLIHAALINAGMTPIQAGFAIGIVCVIFVLAGVYVLMRKLQTPPPLAIPLTCFFLAAFCVRSGILSIKADLLAAGLDVWGLIAALSLTAPVPSPGTPDFGELSRTGEGQGGGSDQGVTQNRSSWPPAALAATCFAFATAAKITSLFGIATIVTWLLLRRDLKNALRVLGIYLFVCALIVVVVQLASQGRAIGVFLASAGAGGGVRRLLEAPQHFLHATASRDRAVGGFWLAAIIALLARRNWISLPMILMAYSTLGTLAIFGSPGTDMNHLMDLHIASLLALAVECRAGWLGRGLLAVVSILTLHAAHSCINDVDFMRTERTRHRLLACIADAQNSPVAGPIFAQNPTIPILAGQRPYMLDCMIFGVIDARHPQTGDMLLNDLKNQRFRAVIVTPELTHNTMPTPTDPWPPILELMKTKYELKATEGRTQVYLPRSP